MAVLRCQFHSINPHSNNSARPHFFTYCPPYPPPAIEHFHITPYLSSSGQDICPPKSPRYLS